VFKTGIKLKWLQNMSQMYGATSNLRRETSTFFRKQRGDI